MQPARLSSRFDHAGAIASGGGPSARHFRGRDRRAGVAAALLGAALAAVAGFATPSPPVLTLASLLSACGIAPLGAATLSLATLGGLLAWHGARMTTSLALPTARAAMVSALLVALLTPGFGAIGLLPAWLMSLPPLLDRRATGPRLPEIAVQLSAAALLLAPRIDTAAPALTSFASLTMVLACAAALHRRGRVAANDNGASFHHPRAGTFLRRRPGYIRQVESRGWGFTDVQ